MNKTTEPNYCYHRSFWKTEDKPTIKPSPISRDNMAIEGMITRASAYSSLLQAGFEAENIRQWIVTNNNNHLLGVYDYELSEESINYKILSTEACY